MKRKATITIEVPLSITLVDGIPDTYGSDYTYDREWRLEKRDEIVKQVLSTLNRYLPKRYEGAYESYVDMPLPDVKEPGNE